MRATWCCARSLYKVPSVAGKFTRPFLYKGRMSQVLLGIYTDGVISATMIDNMDKGKPLELSQTGGHQGETLTDTNGVLRSKTLNSYLP